MERSQRAHIHYPIFGVESYRRQLMMSGTNMASKRLKDIDTYLKNKR